LALFSSLLHTQKQHPSAIPFCQISAVPGGRKRIAVFTNQRSSHQTTPSFSATTATGKGVEESGTEYRE